MCFWISLAKFQQTPGSYTVIHQIPQSTGMKGFPSQTGGEQGPGYVRGICWTFLGVLEYLCSTTLWFGRFWALEENMLVSQWIRNLPPSFEPSIQNPWDLKPAPSLIYQFLGSKPPPSLISLFFVKKNNKYWNRCWRCQPLSSLTLLNISIPP